MLIGPGGVCAIETKWTSEPWAVDGDRLVNDRRRCPLRQAQDGAAKVRLQLRCGRQHIDVAVTPVLVIWGPGAPDLPAALLVSGVLVLEGRRHRQWGDVFASADISPEVVAAAHRVLADHQLDQRRWEAGHPTELPT